MKASSYSDNAGNLSLDVYKLTPAANVSVTESPVTSADGPVERLQFTRSGSLSDALVVTFTIDQSGSTAVAGEDYGLQGEGMTFDADSLTGTVEFAPGVTTVDVFVIPTTGTHAPVSLTLQAGAGYDVDEAGATVPVNIVAALPSSTVDLSDIRTDVTYKVDVTVVTYTGTRFKFETTVKLVTLTVQIGSEIQDLRDDIDLALDNAGYTTRPLGNERLRVYSTADAPLLQFKLKFYDAKNAAGQPVAVGDLTAPTLSNYSGVRVTYNGTRLTVPE